MRRIIICSDRPRRRGCTSSCPITRETVMSASLLEKCKQIPPFSWPLPVLLNDLLTTVLITFCLCFFIPFYNSKAAYLAEGCTNVRYDDPTELQCRSNLQSPCRDRVAAHFHFLFLFLLLLFGSLFLFCLLFSFSSSVLSLLSSFSQCASHLSVPFSLPLSYLSLLKSSPPSLSSPAKRKPRSFSGSMSHTTCAMHCLLFLGYRSTHGAPTSPWTLWRASPWPACLFRRVSRSLC